jgi:hypothetical protein
MYVDLEELSPPPLSHVTGMKDKFHTVFTQEPIPVTVRYKAWVCSSSLGGVVGSNPAGGMDSCLLQVLCVVRQRFLRRDGHLSRGDAASVVRLSVIVKSEK